MCSAGSSTSINDFFTTELPHFGRHHSTPPASFAPCGASGVHWWKRNDTFSWDIEGSAGATGTFWGWGTCHLD
jgi:hypothetical protein